MYTGTLIDELIESVERAEKDARTKREDARMEQWMQAQLWLDSSFHLQHAGAY